MVLERPRLVGAGTNPRLQTTIAGGTPALQKAVIREHGIDRILSFDRHIDGIPGVTRLY